MKKLRSIFLTAAVLSVSLALSACIMSPTSPKDTFVITTENSAVVSWSGAEANDYMPSISTDGFTFKSAYDRTCDFIWVSSGYIF